MYIRKENRKNVIQTPTFLSHITTRSEPKKLLKGLPPPKKQKLLQSPPPSDYPLEPARLPPPEACSATSTSPLLSPRNKFVYGKECVICYKYEFKYGKKGVLYREIPRNLTLPVAAVIKNSAKLKLQYKPLYNDITNKELNV